MFKYFFFNNSEIPGGLRKQMCATISMVLKNAQADVSELNTMLVDVQKIVPSLRIDNFGNGCIVHLSMSYRNFLFQDFISFKFFCRSLPSRLNKYLKLVRHQMEILPVALLKSPPMLKFGLMIPMLKLMIVWFCDLKI